MISINTNISSQLIRQNLEASTKLLNNAIEQMTTGYKINSAKDNAANYSIASDLTTKINSYMVAEDNVLQGIDLMSTAGDSLDQIETKLTRLRALQEQAMNGTYGTNSLEAINTEVNAIIDEIERLYDTTSFNTIDLFKSAPGQSTEISFQVGINSSPNSTITVETGFQLDNLDDLRQIGIDTTTDFLAQIDTMLETVSSKQTEYGATQNRLMSALEEISTQYENLVSSRSTIRDADIAKVSSTYIQQQILQQAAATLLATANQNAGIALNLI